MVEAWISCVPLSPKPFPAIFLEAEVLLQARGQTLTQMTAACLIWMMMMVRPSRTRYTPSDNP